MTKSAQTSQGPVQSQASQADSKIQQLPSKSALTHPASKEKNLSAKEAAQIPIQKLEKRLMQDLKELVEETKSRLPASSSTSSLLGIEEVPGQSFGWEREKTKSFKADKTRVESEEFTKARPATPFGRPHSQVALCVNKAVHYFFLLNAIDQQQGAAQLLKTPSSGIYLENKQGRLSSLLKSKEIVASFKEMLDVAEESMKDDKLASLALLQRMRSNDWAKGVMRFHAKLKSHYQTLYHQVVDQIAKDSGQAFAEIIHQIDRHELLNKIQGGDKQDQQAQTCPHLFQLTHLMDRIKFTIIEEVLSQTDVKQRAAIIELFIKVAYQALVENQDLSTATAVWAGLQSESIHKERLTQTWQGTSKESKKMQRYLQEHLSEMRSDTYERDIKRAMDMPVKSYSIPLLNPFLATLAMAKERQKSLSNGIRTEQKLLEAEVSFFNQCKTLKQDNKLPGKIEELTVRLKELQAEKSRQPKELDDPDLTEKIEILLSHLEIAQLIEKAPSFPTESEVLGRSMHFERIRQLEKGIEKYDQQMHGILDMILKLADHMGHYLREVSHYSTKTWVKPINFNPAEREEAEDAAYDRSLKLEPPHRS